MIIRDRNGQPIVMIGDDATKPIRWKEATPKPKVRNSEARKEHPKRPKVKSSRCSECHGLGFLDDGWDYPTCSACRGRG